MNEEQLQGAEKSEQGRGSKGQALEDVSIDLDAVFETEEFKKRFQSAVDSEVRTRIDKFKANKAKQVEESEPIGVDGVSELDARIQAMIDRRIQQERETARMQAHASKKAARFGIDLASQEFNDLSPAQKLAMVDALEARVPDIAKSANAGADFNTARQPRDPEQLSPAEMAMAETMGISPDNYKKQKQALAAMRSDAGNEPLERKQ